MSDFEEPVLTTYVERIQAIQAHPVPTKVVNPRGPFPPELLEEPEIVVPKVQHDFLSGATAQNNFNPPRYLTCSLCRERVLESETKEHMCDE
jgi:hypothetical protein